MTINYAHEVELVKTEFPLGKHAMLLSRNISNRLVNSFRNSPVVLLNGARQVGKSTLARQLLAKRLKADYVTLDDAQMLSAANLTPQQFIEDLSLPAVIDEFQLAPETFRAIKLIVDKHRQPGMFLLTGSASAVVLPQLHNALVGRMYIEQLCPLSQGEFIGVKEDFRRWVFESAWKTKPHSHQKKGQQNGATMREIILRGGYPAPALMAESELQRQWFGSYVTSVINQDVRQIADIERLQILPNLLALVASRIGGLLNASDLSSAIGLPNKTLSRYLGLLTAVYLVIQVRPWSQKLSNTISKSPKLYLNDTGLIGYLLNLTPEKLESDRQLFGRLLENFVLCELLRQSAWSEIDSEIYHFRTHQGIEVDFILRARDGRLVPIEVKSASQIQAGDFRGIDYFAGHFPNQYHKGIVLYCGKSLLSFGNKRWAVPVEMLWDH